MPATRRTPYAFFYLEEGCGPDTNAGLLALGILTGEQHRLSREEFDLLRSVPADRWVSRDDLDTGAWRTLQEKGLLLSDSDEATLTALRERDEALSANEWNLYAALYHFMTQWRGVEAWPEEWDDSELSDQTRAAARAFVAHHGPPPGPFPDIRSGRELSLPADRRAEPLFQTLEGRRTTRSYDPDRPMTLEQLGAVLHYVFGCHGYAHNVADVLCIKRTSPSGGGLHPVDVYPIVTNVTDVAPGIYHYNARENSLALLRELEPGEGRRLATSFMCGQRHFGQAHVSFVMTARFFRNHWKYRRHQKAYAGILMDAAHLSQTLYLVSGELGLGAFVTLAINARDIEEQLELDGVAEGVVAMTGCGPRLPGDSPLELHFAPA
jgi:putative peptide maturation dehydrogenase